MSDSGILSDLDSLVTEGWKIRTPCLTGNLLASMPEVIRAKVDDLLDNSGVRSSSIATVLRKWGYDASYSSITRHRRRNEGTGCSCP